MAISKKLETIYHNGQPDGIRSIRRNLSTMTTYVIPRPLLRSRSSPRLYYITVYAKHKKTTHIFRIFFAYFSPFFFGSCVSASNSS